jgi:hypothetical protein
MDQYTNYLDALSQYPQQTDVTSPFLSSASQPPSLSASPVSSEGSDSLIDETVQYGLFAYDQSHTAMYSPYDQKYFGCRSCIRLPADNVLLRSSANNLMAGSTPGHPSPRATIKHEYSFGYDSHMTFDSDFPPSVPTYQHSMGYTPQEHNPMAFDYPVHSNTVSSLTNMLADSAPFATIVPTATSGLSGEEASSYKLGIGMKELSISSPASSPFFYAESAAPSSPLISMHEPQSIQACDPKVLGSPVTVEQSVIQAGPCRIGSSDRHAPAVDSDYSLSGESEVEDENDYDYGMPPNRKKNRFARLSSAAHPYLKPSKAKDKKGRGTKLEIPVPVPGLTKNSRGRSVPKKAEVVPQHVTRAFWCSVEDCDKLFSRGEHLKRHITSIHTNDKRE